MLNRVKFNWLGLALLLAAGSARAWMMDAEGFAETPEKAKLAAYATIAAQIRSEIKSENSASIEVHNKQVDKKESVQMAQKSNLILKGVSYTPVLKAEGGYRTTATFDEEALSQTLAYYEKETIFDPLGIGSARAAEIKDLLLMWQSLILVGSDPENRSRFQPVLDTRLKLVNARIENAVMTVHANSPESTIRVDGKPYRMDELIIVGEGSHQIEIAAPNYKTLSKVVYVGRGGVLKVSENLIPVAGVTREMRLAISPDLQNYFEAGNVSDLMDDFGWQLSDTGRYVLNVGGTVIVREGGEFLSCEFDFNIGIYDGKTKLKSVTFKRKVPAKQATLKRDVTNKLMPDLKQALTALANNVKFPE